MDSYILLFALQESTAMWLTLVTIVSLLVGSFLNVVILRLPQSMKEEWHQECRILLEINKECDKLRSPAIANIAWPCSYCPSCNTPLKAWHNIPILSYLLLKGHCAFCNSTITPRYPAVELLTALLGLLLAWIMGPSTNAMLSLVLLYFLIALTFIDLDHKLLPDQLTLPLVWLGLVLNSFGVYTNLEDALWGAIAGYLSLWSVYWGFRLATGKHGMGYGDFKLLAALGAWLGWQALPMIVLIAAVTGIVVGLVLRLRTSPTNPQIAFGPFLSIGGLSYLLCGQQIWGLFNAVFIL